MQVRARLLVASRGLPSARSSSARRSARSAGSRPAHQSSLRSRLPDPLQRVERRGRVREPIPRLARDERAEEAAQRGRHVDALEADALEDPPRLAAGQQVEQRRAERVRIRRRVDEAGELLDRHVAERADRRRARGRALDVRGAEVDDRDRAVGATHEVRRLDVAMDHHRRQRLEIDQHAKHLARDLDDLVLGVPVVARGARRAARR